MTAVEWLMQTLEQNNIIDLDCIDSDKYYTIIEQAKEMEKQQILTSSKESWKFLNQDKTIDQCAEDYYNKTYGSKGSDNSQNTKQ